jgi:CheY-like chemotaxis protein
MRRELFSVVDPALDRVGAVPRCRPKVTMMAHGPTVLLVEDNDDNLQIYSTILSYAGYHVLEATDGEAALATARSGQPDLILMDVSIPKIDGWEVTRMLKADPATASIPIVALTAHALASDRERADEIGFDGYIPKPAEPRLVLAEVVRRVGKAVETPRA